MDCIIQGLSSRGNSLSHRLGPFSLLRTKKLLLHMGRDWEVSGKDLEGKYLVPQYSQLLSRKRSVALRTGFLGATLADSGL
jgi:hypothetical protein